MVDGDTLDSASAVTVTDDARARNRERKQRQRAREKAQKALRGVTQTVTVPEVNRPPFAAAVRRYEDIPEAVRRRREELGLSQLEVDEIAGTQTGYCGKVEQPRKSYGRIMGDLAFQLIMTALGLKMVVVETDPSRVNIGDRAKVGERRRGAQPKKGKR
jgi:hypothetical protein